MLILLSLSASLATLKSKSISDNVFSPNLSTYLKSLAFNKANILSSVASSDETSNVAISVLSLKSTKEKSSFEYSNEYPSVISVADQLLIGLKLLIFNLSLEILNATLFNAYLYEKLTLHFDVVPFFNLFSSHVTFNEGFSSGT